MYIDGGIGTGLIMLVGALAFASVIQYCVKNNTSIFGMLGIAE